MTTPTRHLSLTGLVLFGVAYMAPLIVLGTFGVVAQASHGATAGSYLLALAAMLFTAASYGRMAGLFPVAGSAYTYVSQAMDHRLGFMVGWAVALDYVFIPMVVWLIGAAFLHDGFPSVPVPLFVLAFIVGTTAINWVGIRVAKSTTAVLIGLQVVVIVLFVGLAVAFVMAGHGSGGLNAQPFANLHSGLLPIAAGAAIAAYSYLGFDAVTTLAEETHDARRVVPIAIWLTALIGGALFVIVSYATQLAHPGYAFANPDAAANEIAGMIGGQVFKGVFLAGMVVTQIAGGIATQAAGARLIFAMARDGVLPRRLLGQLHPRFQTPTAAVLLTGVVGLLALWLDVDSATSLINFGAFTAFTAVNISVIAIAVKGARKGVLGWYLAPLIGACVDAWLLTQLERPALILGGCWLVLGLGVLTYLTRGFRQMPPALHMDEH